MERKNEQKIEYLRCKCGQTKQGTIKYTYQHRIDTKLGERGYNNVAESKQIFDKIKFIKMPVRCWVQKLFQEQQNVTKWLEKVLTKIRESYL